MSQLKMDVQNSSVKHLPVKVNNYVKRKQEDTKKTASGAFFKFFEEILQEYVYF